MAGRHKLLKAMKVKLKHLWILMYNMLFAKQRPRAKQTLKELLKLFHTRYFKSEKGQCCVTRTLTNLIQVCRPVYFHITYWEKKKGWTVHAHCLYYYQLVFPVMRKHCAQWADWHGRIHHVEKRTVPHRTWCQGHHSLANDYCGGCRSLPLCVCAAVPWGEGSEIEKCKQKSVK